jgi:serine/arginine repetitive matrix protein 1
MADGFFKGTTTDQDSRFADKQKKLIKSMKFPAVFDTKVSRCRLSAVLTRSGAFRLI